MPPQPSSEPNLQAQQGQPCDPASGTQPPTLLKDLPTTPELSEALEVWRKHFCLRKVPVWDEEELKLQYHFGGQDVACIRTPQGRAVLAAGTSEEVAARLDQLTREERTRVTLVFPEPWGAVELLAVTSDEA
jgi:hypothetical protein